MGFDGWLLLMALAVILVPLLLAGALLARPSASPRVEPPPSPRARSNAAGLTPTEKP